jgi:peptidoglycan/LPS O-acetylase OafA/YrhL
MSNLAPDYRPDIDGLRALAVTAVVAFHLMPGWLPGGFLGVDVFFVISGYLISGLVLAQLRVGRFSITTFYLRRARRILPALLLMLFVVSLLALLILVPAELRSFAHELIASVAFVPNLALLADVGYFDKLAYTKPLLHLWSLGVEEQFYLIWPAVLVVVAGRDRSARTMTWIAVLAAVSFTAHMLISRQSTQASFYLPVTRFWELMIGALLAVPASAKQLDQAGSQRMRSAASALGILLIAGSMLAGPIGALGSFYGVLPTLGAALFIAAGPLAALNRTAFALRPVIYVGLISYPLYLWHWPLLSLLRIVQLEGRSTEHPLRALMVAIAVIAAILTYHLVERPLRTRADLRRIGAWLGIAMILLAASGLVIIRADGFPQRTSLKTDPFAWPAKLHKDSACLDLYETLNHNAEAYCVRNDYGRPPRVVLLGDSHANVWWPALLAAHADSSLLNIGAQRCLYLQHTEFWDDGSAASRSRCPVLIAAAYRAITPDSRLVILAARNSMYIEVPANQHFTSLEFSTTATVEVFERSLMRDLPRLLESDREVILVLQVPELDFLPEHCLKRPIASLLPEIFVNCSVPRSAVERDQAVYRTAITRVVHALADPDLHVVDPMDALCDARNCHAMIDGELIYRDSDHLNEAGSRYVWEKIRPHELRAFTQPSAP